MKKGESWKNNEKVQKKTKKVKKKEEECTVDYCCDPQCIGCG